MIEVTITDFPALLKRQGVRNNMQRLVNFSVGFKGKTFLNFNQGISLMKHTPAKAFVTVSKNIKLARGKVNTRAPVDVVKERPYHLSAG
ncbi:hypothetical protein [Xanthomonas theicola]|uniref:hypothetical protein n=1 Tax=Xanthomonas theicola TaxID=56464 RepID=UPI000FF889D5|nr:hypothetical protein [Xanthomonas theicola]